MSCSSFCEVGGGLRSPWSAWARDIGLDSIASCRREISSHSSCWTQMTRRKGRKETEIGVASRKERKEATQISTEQQELGPSNILQQMTTLKKDIIHLFSVRDRFQKSNRLPHHEAPSFIGAARSSPKIPLCQSMVPTSNIPRRELNAMMILVRPPGHIIAIIAAFVDMVVDCAAPHHFTRTSTTRLA